MIQVVWIPSGIPLKHSQESWGLKGVPESLCQLLVSSVISRPCRHEQMTQSPQTLPDKPEVSDRPTTHPPWERPVHTHTHTHLCKHGWTNTHAHLCTHTFWPPLSPLALFAVFVCLVLSLQTWCIKAPLYMWISHCAKLLNSNAQSAFSNSSYWSTLNYTSAEIIFERLRQICSLSSEEHIYAKKAICNKKANCMHMFCSSCCLH